jgi:all-trans-retinol 13,14-reductase
MFPQVPQDLDAIVIGSGIGGMSSAVVMAKAGKCVLVLEQMENAGGFSGSFTEDGYTFDRGLFYVAQMSEQTESKTLVDQITDGQVEWAPLDNAYDVVSIGYGEDNRRYDVLAGLDNWKALLIKQFPQEEQAILEFFMHLQGTERNPYEFPNFFVYALRSLPMWLSWLLVKAGPLHMLTKIFSKEYNQSVFEVCSKLTDNDELKTVLMYLDMVISVQPSKLSFAVHSAMQRCFGSMKPCYTVGGASELAFNMIPIVERSGGRVLVKARVEEILHDGKTVTGVRVRNMITNEICNIESRCIISNAGMDNTFKKMLPPNVTRESKYAQLVSDIKPGCSGINVFIGLNASNEQLKLKAQNTYIFPENNCGENMSKYMSLSRKDAMKTEPPFLFVAFPSAKDPKWEAYPERENKSTCFFCTSSNWDWFKNFEGDNPDKGSKKYEETKTAIGNVMLEMVLKVYPHIRDHIDYILVQTPLHCKMMIGRRNGEHYGLDHGMGKRLADPMVAARLRPETDIPGLYLTGSDVLCSGITASIYSGLLTAEAILKRNVTHDLLKIHTDTTKKGTVLSRIMCRVKYGKEDYTEPQ